MQNQYDRIKTFADTVIKAAKQPTKAYTKAQKQAAEQPNYAVEGLSLLTHALIQNEEDVRENGYLLESTGKYYYATKGEGKDETVLGEVYIKTSGPKVTCFITTGEQVREASGAYNYQISLYPEAQEGEDCRNKVKAFDSKGLEMINQKFTLVDGKMTEVTPSKTQDGAQAQ